jgi:hypothetical protein
MRGPQPPDETHRTHLAAELGPEPSQALEPDQLRPERGDGNGVVGGVGVVLGESRGRSHLGC